MPCNCHGRNGVKVTVARPYDQCTACARKHVKNAWGAWNEFTYEEDNRDYVSDQLRKAADHLKTDHRETALKCRDLAMVIEENKDLDGGGLGTVAEQLNALRMETLSLFYQEHGDAKERLEAIKSKAENGDK